MLREYYRYVKEYWALAEISPWLFALSLLTALLYKGLSLVLPFIAALIISALTEGNAEKTYLYIALYAASYVGYRFFLWLSWRTYSWSVNYSYRRLHDKVFDKLINVDANFTRKISKGRFMNTINSDLVDISEMTDELAEFLTTPLQIFAVVVIVSKYGLIYPAIFFVSRVVYITVRNHADRRYNFFWLKSIREDDRYSNFLGQVATGLQEVKTFNMLPKLHKKLGVIQNRYDKYYKAQRAECNVRDCDAYLVFYAFEFLLYLVLIFQLVHSRLDLATLILIISYHSSIIDYLDAFITSAMDIRLYNASVRRVNTILNYKSEKEFEFGTTSIDQLSGSVTFKNLSLEINRQKILQNISLKVRPHETLAIVGFPGAGKTMLFNLLLRLKQPTKGSIYLDDININDFSKEAYTSSVAVANQTPFIFNQSIRNNLDFVDTDIKHQVEACKIAGIHDFIENLPQGYNTILRENASNVSGGQKQMISIARTILTDAEVLLLDDVTTSLDPDTAKLVPALLKRLEKDHTVIMITKKPELMQVADRIVVLDHGKIEAVGTHEKLIKTSKVYRALQLISPDKEGRRV